jgi:hypothetical protein
MNEKKLCLEKEYAFLLLPRSNRLQIGGAILDSYRQNLVPLGGESCSSSREVTVVLNFISERAVVYLEKGITFHSKTEFNFFHAGFPQILLMWSTCTMRGW